MRAYVVLEFGDPGHVAERDKPEPTEGQLVVHVRAAAVHPMDPVYRSGVFKDYMEHRLPLTPGMDYAGTVEVIGSGVEGFSVGDEVFGEVGNAHVGDGAFAEYVAVDAGKAMRRPANIPPEVATTLTRSGTTALEAIEATHAQSGDVIAVFGAGGGLGSFVTELAARRGLHVVALTSADKADYVRGLGADEVIDYADDDAIEQIRARHPDGVAAVVDLAHDAQSIGSVVPALRSDGWIVTPMGRGTKEALATSDVNVHVTSIPTERANELIDSLGDEPLKVAIERVPLDQAADALDRQASRSVRGKMVIVPD